MTYCEGTYVSRLEETSEKRCQIPPLAPGTILPSSSFYKKATGELQGANMGHLNDYPLKGCNTKSMCSLPIREETDLL
ncbi:hypothetical protein E2C01_039035 [Portunus trituberculatus]|uniref:Uncharacterized protein n=1 Tax=Portunus trituberculatus TaxID=210409 RepID=A0A5B7FK32_PORTR|nr:hypothetical protein [Portunus trituberculatus]